MVPNATENGPLVSEVINYAVKYIDTDQASPELFSPVGSQLEACLQAGQYSNASFSPLSDSSSIDSCSQWFKKLINIKKSAKTQKVHGQEQFVSFESQRTKHSLLHEWVHSCEAE